MPKVQRFTAVILGLFIIIMLFILVIGMDFQDINSFNDIFKKNPGLFWGCTSITVVGIFILRYAEITYASEIKKFIEKMIVKDTTIVNQNKTITNQNETIIDNQQKDLVIRQKHLTEVTKLHNLIAERAEKDNKKAEAINRIYSKINKNEKERDNQINIIVGKSNIQLEKITKEIKGIKNKTNRNGRLIDEIVKSKKHK